MTTRLKPAVGIVHGAGTRVSDSISARLSRDEVVLNAGAAQAFAHELKARGLTIDQYNALYAPKDAKTKTVKGVLHAAYGGVVDQIASDTQPTSAYSQDTQAQQAKPEASGNPAPATPLFIVSPDLSMCQPIALNQSEWMMQAMQLYRWDKV